MEAHEKRIRKELERQDMLRRKVFVPFKLKHITLLNVFFFVAECVSLVV